MPYTSRENSPVLTAEELDVKAALSEYSSEGASWADWVPTAILLRLYRSWLARYRWQFEPGAPDPLTYRQFGRAICRVFPDADRCRRSYHGRKCRWGYCRIIGPDSVQSAWLLAHSSTT